MSDCKRGLSDKRGRLKFELSGAETVKYVPCPVCGQLMNRHNFARISGTIIDTCKYHGVWLDNELNRILKFIDSGGLEKAHANEVADAVHCEKMRSKGPLP
jgi:Zn-finger nucleic acid-binding protein